MSVLESSRSQNAFGPLGAIFVVTLALLTWTMPTGFAQQLSGKPKLRVPGQRAPQPRPRQPGTAQPSRTQPGTAQPSARTQPATNNPRPPRRPPTANTRSRGRNNDEDEEKYKPREVQLRTRDGVTLRAFYFPSEKEKEATTVLLIHEWRGQGSPYYKTLATALQEAGCAVLVPDFRGHGGSSIYVDARGKEQKFDVSRMSKRDVENIISFDLEKAKAFLKEENNEEKLNLNALVVVGIRDGCVLASQWAQRDWAFPTVGTLKQGQDVKGLVLISPPKQLKGIPIDAPLGDLNLLRLPIMIVSGTRNSEAKSASRLVKRIEGAKRRAGSGTVRDFKSINVNTALSGPSLVNTGGKVVSAIVDFVTNSIPVSKETTPWVERP